MLFLPSECPLDQLDQASQLWTNRWTLMSTVASGVRSRSHRCEEGDSVLQKARRDMREAGDEPSVQCPDYFRFPIYLHTFYRVSNKR